MDSFKLIRVSMVLTLALGLFVSGVITHAILPFSDEGLAPLKSGVLLFVIAAILVPPMFRVTARILVALGWVDPDALGLTDPENEAEG